MRRDGGGSALELHSWQVDDRRVRQGQNRTREIRPPGIAGGLVETWARVEAIRAHKAETPKQTSVYLRSRALHFYLDPFPFSPRSPHSISPRSPHSSDFMRLDYGHLCEKLPGGRFPNSPWVCYEGLLNIPFAWA